MKPILGAVLLLMGTALFAWIGYNLFIQRLPAFPSDRPLAILPGIGFGAALISGGLKWVLGKEAD